MPNRENLGLQQDSWFDGRRAVRNSTEVALDYLEELHSEFDNDGCWPWPPTTPVKAG